MSGATTPRRLRHPRWRRARRRGGCRAAGGSAGIPVLKRLRLCAMGDHRRLSWAEGRPVGGRRSAGAARRGRDRRRRQVLGLLGTGTKSKDGFAPEHRSVMVSDLFAGTPPGASVHPEYLVLRAARGFLVSYSLPPVAIARPPRPRHRLCNAGHQSVTRGDPGGPVRGRADGDRRGRRGDRLATLLFHTGREAGTAAVNSVPRLDPRIMR